MASDEVEAAALLEYEEFSEEINALSMQQALRVCEMEGIAPRAYNQRPLLWGHCEEHACHVL